MNVPTIPIVVVNPNEDNPAYKNMSREAYIAKHYRSPDYDLMSPQDQWDEDKRLGILDWDGN